jgi:hypothetical protein
MAVCGGGGSLCMCGRFFLSLFLFHHKNLMLCTLDLLFEVGAAQGSEKACVCMNLS